MIETLGTIMILSAGIFLVLVKISMRRDLARRHRQLEESLKDGGES